MKYLIYSGRLGKTNVMDVIGSSMPSTRYRVRERNAKRNGCKAKGRAEITMLHRERE